MENIKGILLRPVLYKCIPRVGLGVALSLLWDNLFNLNQLRSVWEYPVLCWGICLLAMAWVEYLRLDGMTFHHLMEEVPKRKKKNHWTKQMIDYVEEELEDTIELTDDQIKLVRLIADVLIGLAFLIPALCYIFFQY